MTVTRRGDVVEWGPAPGRDTPAVTYRFGLVAYLDALDQARRVARAVERRLGSRPDAPDSPLLLPGEDDEAVTHRVTQALLRLAWPSP